MDNNLELLKLQYEELERINDKLGFNLYCAEKIVSDLQQQLVKLQADYCKLEEKFLQERNGGNHVNG